MQLVVSTAQRIGVHGATKCIHYHHALLLPSPLLLPALVDICQNGTLTFVDITAMLIVKNRGGRHIDTTVRSTER